MSKSKFYLRSKVLSPRFTDMLVLRICMYEDFFHYYDFSESDYTLVRVLFDEYEQLVNRFNSFQRINNRPLWLAVSWDSLDIKKPDFLK